MNMKDNWNILARLLDTPAASDPPVEEEKEPTAENAEPADSASPSDATQPNAATESDSADGPAAASAPEKTGSILDALKAKIPPQILPGFGSFSDGSTNSDEKETPASDQHLQLRRSPRQGLAHKPKLTRVKPAATPLM